jgi:hypothetical protein
LGRSPIIGVVLLAIGEWVPASMLLGLAFLVAALGVAGLGWYVLRGDRLNRLQGAPPDEGDL